MTKVLILGATGQIGKHVAQMLDKQPGVESVLFTRSPQKLPRPELGFKGDVTNLDDVTKAMQGVDVVVASLLYPNMEWMANNVILAMKANNVSRVIWVSTDLYGDLAPWLKVVTRIIGGHPNKLGGFHDDNRRGALALETSGLDYTIVRPNILTNKDVIDKTVTAPVGQRVAGKSISRKTVAQFLVEMIENPSRHVKTSLSVGASK